VNGILAIGVSCILVLLAGALVRRRWQARKAHPDRRSRREFNGSIALFLVALCAAMSALLSIAQLADLSVRRTFAGIAWAALIAYFVIQLQDDETP
jgi:hypothetical protein